MLKNGYQQPYEFKIKTSDQKYVTGTITKKTVNVEIKFHHQLISLNDESI